MSGIHEIEIPRIFGGVMKHLIFLTILTGCALHVPELERRGFKKKEENHVTKLQECVTELVGKYGVPALDANKVCQSIYRREDVKKSN